MTDIIESMDLNDALQTRFDDESVQRALSRIECSNPSVADRWLMHSLLSGRGASELWKRIEPIARRDVSLAGAAFLADYLPRKEALEFRDQIAIDDEQIIEQIASGNFPNVRILPRERQQSIFQQLKTRAAAENDPVRIAAILAELLDFDRKSFRDRLPSAPPNIIDLASTWCMNFEDKQKIQSTLSKLLWLRPTPRLVRLAGQCLADFDWTLESIILLMGLLRTIDRRSKTRLMKQFFQTDPSVHDSWVISEWMHSTRCCRESFRLGQYAVKNDWTGCRDIVRVAALCTERKFVRRWLDRLLESRINETMIADCIPHILKIDPSKRNKLLAMKALRSASSTGRHEILLQLARRSPGADVVELILRIASKYPNSPNSFALMCQIAKSEPKVAVPWILDWNATAMPTQITKGLSAVVVATGEGEHLQMLRDWYAKIQSEELPVEDWWKAGLLHAVLRVNPRDRLLDEIPKLLEQSPVASHFALRKLGRSYSRLCCLE